MTPVQHESAQLLLVRSINSMFASLRQLQSSLRTSSPSSTCCAGLHSHIHQWLWDMATTWACAALLSLTASAPPPLCPEQGPVSLVPVVHRKYDDGGETICSEHLRALPTGILRSIKRKVGAIPRRSFHVGFYHFLRARWVVQRRAIHPPVAA